MAALVIVGAGIAGLSVAERLRQLGFDGTITLVGDEAVLPYDRPPLSKQALTGEARPDLPLRDDAWFAAQRIVPILGDPAVAIAGQAVRLASGAALPFDTAVLATGARPRRLALLDEAGIDSHYLRTAADAARLRAAMAAAGRVAVIGGGVIGLEVAATARAAGAEVVVIEAQPRLMARSLSAGGSAELAARHRAAGVRILCGETVVAAEPAAAGAAAGGARLRLSGGIAVAADLVVAGIGAIPELSLAATAGLAVADGIVVDHNARTSRPDIFAVGDVACFPCGFHGRPLRSEQWQHAIDHGRAAAAAIMGDPSPYHAVPWFWSDQGALSLQVVGRTDGDDEVVRDDPKGRVYFHRRGDEIVGATMIDAPRLRRILTRLVGNRTRAPAASLADPAIGLETLGG